MNLSERVNGSQLDQKVRDILDHMQQGTYDVGALESVKIFHNTQDHLESPHTHYLGNATPFARMWTAVQKMGQRYTENGELIHKQKKVMIITFMLQKMVNQLLMTNVKRMLL